MLLSRASFAGLLSAAILAIGAPAANASHIHRPPTSGHAHHSSTTAHHSSTSAHHRTTQHSTAHRRSTHHRYSHRAKFHGQRSIEPDRVREIQAALIKAHYMNGEPDGDWNAGTIAAMQKYQADNGWQTKIMPDSRALIKLGLGYDYHDAINAKDLTFAAPPEGASVPEDQVAGFAQASGVSQ